MILVTLGTQKFEMNRLVKAADRLAELLGEEVFVQCGHSTYQPEKCNYSAFVDTAQFAEMIQNCSVLITHSGVGTIMTGIQAKRPIIVVPRLKKYHEHVDDHQLQIADSFQELNFVIKCQDESKLSEAIAEARNHKFDRYISQRDKVTETIENFIDRLGE